jgi:hypothetical protein
VAYVRAKKIRRDKREYRYFQLVEGRRDPDTGKVRQRVLKHLGRFDSIEAAREAAAAIHPPSE